MRVKAAFLLRMAVVFVLKTMLKARWLRRLLWMGVFGELGIVSEKLSDNMTYPIN